MEDQTDDIQDFLTDISSPHPEGDDPAVYDEKIQDTKEACYEFLELLGYDSDNIFQNITLPVDKRDTDDGTEVPPPGREFDYVVGRSPATTPYIIADAGLGSRAEVTHEYKAIRPSSVVTEYLRLLPSVDFYYFIYFSNAYIIVARRDGLLRAYDYNELTSSESREIQDSLSPPKKLPSGPVLPGSFHPNQTKLVDYEIPPYPSASHSEKIIQNDYSELDLSEYTIELGRANRATSEQEKGDSLESLAELLFESIRFLSVRDTNVNASFGEIDLIVEYIGSDKLTFFDYYGRFLVIECKNWTDPVPAKEVGHFETKLAKTDTELGVLFAWSGISGEDSGRYASSIVESDSAKRPKIITIDERDLYRIAEGTGFYEMLENKLYRRRFDL